MSGALHYREAERLIGESNDCPLGSDDERFVLNKAQVHATLALAAAVIEAGHANSGGLIGRPSPPDGTDPAFPGTPWGRALFGDLHLSDSKDS